MSNVDFERELNKRMNVFLIDKLVQVENDMSKYDKAQHKVLREMEDVIEDVRYARGFVGHLDIVTCTIAS